MRHVLFAQEKGGSGKSTCLQGLAETLPDLPVFEVESSPRLLSLSNRVQFFRMRADRDEIELTGGMAAREEFDGLIDCIVGAQRPSMTDLGANTGAALFSVIASMGDHLNNLGLQFAVVVVTTAEPAALAETPRLLSLAESWAKPFVIENQLHGSVAPHVMQRVSGNATVASLPAMNIDDQAAAIIQAGGIACIERLSHEALAKKFGFARGARILSDCRKFKLRVMQAVQPVAEWLAA